jgi:hypothetical protein
MDRFKRLAPLSGVVVVAGMVTLFALPSPPDTSASGAKVITWFRHHHTEAYVVAAMLAYVAAAAALYFSALGSFLRRSGSDLLATTTTVGGALFAMGALLGTGAVVAINDGPQNFSPEMARALNVIQNDLFFPAVIAGFAIATLSSGVALIRTRSLPLALGIITTVVGVVAVSGIASWFGFLAGGPLILVTAGYVYARTGASAQITLPDMPGQRVATEEPTKATTA